MDAPEASSEDEITNMLIGLKEIHKSRCLKLWDVFETMLENKKIVNWELIIMEDYLGPVGLKPDLFLALSFSPQCGQKISMFDDKCKSASYIAVGIVA